MFFFKNFLFLKFLLYFFSFWWALVFVLRSHTGHMPAYGAVKYNPMLHHCLIASLYLHAKMTLLQSFIHVRMLHKETGFSDISQFRYVLHSMIRVCISHCVFTRRSLHSCLVVHLFSCVCTFTAVIGGKNRPLVCFSLPLCSYQKRLGKLSKVQIFEWSLYFAHR